MIKRSIHEEDIAIINIYAPSIKALKYMNKHGWNRKKKQTMKQ